MINSKEYCSQLEQLKTTLDGKCMESVNRKCIIVHQDNKTSYFFVDQAKTVTAWLGNSGLSTMFTDIAPSDFYLFLSLQNSLNGKNFSPVKDCKRHLEQFLAQKGKKFQEDGIMKLPEKWWKVVGQNSEYMVQ